ESVRIAVDAAYVLIGYSIDAKLLRRCGIEVPEGDLIPSFDEATGESNVPGLYVAGAVRSGVHTNRIFIDNSREHGKAIVAHIAARLGT
ncbi:MAG: thioredoxin reductase, partial [Acidobacteria bacterium]|nr:thioredoxin reductase [Acidobacteriota bacterium]